jgi:hypothetical protein
MQDREEEGCWNITIGYVFIQEPDESSPKCSFKESRFKCDLMTAHGGWGRGVGGGAGRERLFTILKITNKLSLKIL